MANQRFGQPAGVRRLPMRVDAPLGHRAEGRAKPGSVCLTSRDAAVQGSGGKNAGPGTAGRRSTSQDAGLHLEHVEEELLDYEEEEEVHEVAVQAGAPVETPKVNKRAVQGDRLVGRHQELVAGNLFRGEDYGQEQMRVGGCNVGLGVAGQSSGKVMGSQAVVGHGEGNVDVAIQVGIGTEFVAGKSEVSQGGVSDVVADGESWQSFLQKTGFAMRGAVLPHHHVRLRARVKEDLRMWIGILQEFNGVTMLVE
ncbi:hypothetical protein NDU88_001197 [Pleurodeles waltl]|uniref:Uncharacterized protein n=1 Tax=Pleurodeles waltl TaxID=8319 RepID=A0AAV7Q9D4_PLEWA|nr:hypothetical protein NDU88_001197 [Pleurodeles waltl]